MNQKTNATFKSCRGARNCVSSGQNIITFGLAKECVELYVEPTVAVAEILNKTPVTLSHSQAESRFESERERLVIRKFRNTFNQMDSAKSKNVLPVSF